MSSDFDYKSLLQSMAWGGALGGLRGAGTNWFTGKKLNDSSKPFVNAVAGVGFGAAFDAIRQAIAKKEDEEPILPKIPEGLYYGEGGLYGNVKSFKGTPINRFGRHGFVAGVFDEAPDGVESQKLPNGQYAVTFSGIPTLTFGIPDGGFYATINGKSNVKGKMSDIDYRILSSMVDRKAKIEGNYYPKLYPLLSNKQEVLEKVNRLYSIMRNISNKSLGKYKLTGNQLHRNNCLSLAGYLMNRVGINKEYLPKRLGVVGSVDKNSIANYIYE